MTEKQLFEKNLELSTEFSKYLLEHPELENQIPEGAQVVFLVESDPELSRRNQTLAEEQRKNGQRIVLVRIKGVRPEHSRLIEPHLEKVA